MKKEEFKYQYQKDQLLKENLNPDADQRTIEEHLKKQIKGLIFLGVVIFILFIVFVYITLKTYE